MNFLKIGYKYTRNDEKHAISYSINQSFYYAKKAGHIIHINVRHVKVDLYKFTLPALSAP